MAATPLSARATVFRSVLLFAPFLTATLGALAFLIQDAAAEGVDAGGIVALVLVGLVGLLLGYQVVQSVRDLFAHLEETTGLVERRWSRNDLFIFQNTYVFIERNVFRLTPEQAIDVDLGDTVRIVHYPHTSTVETIDVVARAGSDDDEQE